MLEQKFNNYGETVVESILDMQISLL
jgi:hypothetical protein